MKCNVGLWDRAIRVIVGGIILALGMMRGQWWGLVGTILIATGLLGRCPLYLPFGINSNKNADKSDQD